MNINLSIFMVILLSMTTCTVKKTNYQFNDIISADSISVRLTRGKVIEEKKDFAINVVHVTICNKTSIPFYIHSGGLNGSVNSTTGEDIYNRLYVCKRDWLLTKFHDTLPRANKAIDSITLKRLNDEMMISISKIPDKNVQRYFKDIFQDMIWCLYFIEPKATYEIEVPVLKYKNKKSDKLYFFHRDFFNVIKANDKNKIYKEYFDKYIKLPEVLGGYNKLNGTLISDTIELK